MAPEFKVILLSTVIFGFLCGCGPSMVSVPSDPPLETITPSHGGGDFDIEGRQVTYDDMDEKDEADNDPLNETTDITRTNDQEYLEEYDLGDNPVPPGLTALKICLYTTLMNLHCREGDTI